MAKDSWCQTVQQAVRFGKYKDWDRRGLDGTMVLPTNGITFTPLIHTRL